MRLFLIFLLTILCQMGFSEEIFFTGDTIITGSSDINFFKPIQKFMKKDDLLSMNFEGTLDSKNHFIPKCLIGIHCFVFSSEVETLKKFHKNTIFNLANNHSMDYGILGQDKTVKILKENEFNFFGTEKKPFFIKNNIVFIGASPHLGTFSIFNKNLIETVKNFKEKNFIVVINLHMGAEGIDKFLVKNENEIFLGQNRGNIYKLSRDLIDNGADLIVGHGPHIIRGIEIYKEKLILYSLGNFLTYGSFDLRNELSYSIMVKVNLKNNGNFQSGKIYSFQQTKNIFPELWQKGEVLIESDKPIIFLNKVNKLNNFNIRINDDGTF